jgi:hypothetical protein
VPPDAVGALLFQLPVGADIPAQALGIVTPFLAQAVAEVEAGFAVAVVLVDLAEQGGCRRSLGGRHG